ncbi:MAG: hypothetical protein R3C59_21795 [Planctomycetaceae bacterium]
MPVRPSRKNTDKHATPQVVVPDGAPSWVTPELIEKTLEVWQRYYEEELIPEDALAMIMGTSQLFQSLADGRRHETIRRSGPRKQP